MNSFNYTDNVLKHFYHPKNVGEIKDADGKATIGSPECGDFIKVWIKVKNDRIIDFKYKVFGCGAAIATTSVVSELAIGKTFKEAVHLTEGDVVSALGGLPENKTHCSLLGIRGLHTAMADYLVRYNHKKYEQRLKLYMRLGYDVRGSCERLVGYLDHISKQAKIFDIGTGNGYLAVAIANSDRSCISIDVSVQKQHIASLNAVYFKVDDKIDLQLQDATHLNFATDTFDVALSLTALHHIAKTKQVLKEIVRVTGKNGKIILADFNDKGQRLVDYMHRKEGKKKHKSLGWDAKEIQSWFERQGHKATCMNDGCLWILVVDKQ